MARFFKNQQAFVRWNDEMAHKYDPEDYHLRSNIFIRWIERQRVRFILRLLDVSTMDNVLEVGCGAGNVLEQVLSPNLVGIDLSLFLLNKSRKRLKKNRAYLIQANGEKLPFASRFFSRVYFTEVLEHVINPIYVAQVMARVVKTSGKIVISIPNEALIDRTKSIISQLRLSQLILDGKNKYHVPKSMTDEWHLHYFDLTYLKDVVEGIISIDSIQPIPFAAFPLRYVVSGHVLSNS